MANNVAIQRQNGTIEIVPSNALWELDGTQANKSTFFVMNKVIYTKGNGYSIIRNKRSEKSIPFISIKGKDILLWNFKLDLFAHQVRQIVYYLCYRKLSLE